MWNSRLLHKLAKVLDSEGQVRPSIGEKVKFANYLPVKGRVFKEVPILYTQFLCAV